MACSLDGIQVDVPVKNYGARRMGDQREVADRSLHRGVVTGPKSESWIDVPAEDTNRGRLRTRQIGDERRRRFSSPRDTRHGESADETDEQHDADVGRSLTMEPGREAIAKYAQQ